MGDCKHSFISGGYEEACCEHCGTRISLWQRERIRELEQANAKQAMLIAEFKGLREPKIQHLERCISELEKEVKMWRERTAHEILEHVKSVAAKQ